MRSLLGKGAAIVGLLTFGGLIASCGSGKGNMTLLETNCIKVVAVDGSVEFGSTVSVAAGTITYTVKPGCECHITSLKYSVYQDANGNGACDPGEQLFGQSGTGLTSPGGTMAGGTASVMASLGKIRWEATATDSCGATFNNYGCF